MQKRKTIDISNDPGLTLHLVKSLTELGPNFTCWRAMLMKFFSTEDVFSFVIGCESEKFFSQTPSIWNCGSLNTRSSLTQQAWCLKHTSRRRYSLWFLDVLCKQSASGWPSLLYLYRCKALAWEAESSTCGCHSPGGNTIFRWHEIFSANSAAGLLCLC